jgi:hypothetical protein
MCKEQVVGKKRKRSHIGSTIEDYVEFKKMQTSKTIEALNEKKRQDEETLLQSTSFPKVNNPRERLKNPRKTVSLGYFVGKGPYGGI